MSFPNHPGDFHAGHACIMTELSAFASMVLRMIQTEERLSVALPTREVLAREMGHRVKTSLRWPASMRSASAHGVHGRRMNSPTSCRDACKQSVARRQVRQFPEITT